MRWSTRFHNMAHIRWYTKLSCILCRINKIPFWYVYLKITTIHFSFEGFDASRMKCLQFIIFVSQLSLSKLRRLSDWSWHFYNISVCQIYIHRLWRRFKLVKPAFYWRHCVDYRAINISTFVHNFFIDNLWCIFFNWGSFALLKLIWLILT